MKQQIFKNAKIYTMDGNCTAAEALACKDGLIQAAGNEADVMKLAEADAEIIDLGGKTVIPGLIDSHTHYHWFAKSNNELHLLGYTKPEILDMVKKQVETQPEGSWILGSGWVNALFEGGAYPCKEDLDAVAPDNPVFLSRCCGNAYWVNSKALEIAGLDENSDDPNCEMLRNPDGSLAGIMVGWYAQNVTKHIPDFPDDVYPDMLDAVQQEYFKYGITSISDEGSGAYTAFGTGNGRQTEAGLRKLYEEGRMKLRIYQNVSATQTDYMAEVLARGPESGSYGKRYDYRGVKIWTDGSVGSHTANLIDGYTDQPDVHGKQYYTDEALVKIFKDNDAAGFQTTCHAIGDGAIKQVIDCYEKAFGADDTADRRFKIVHCQLTRPEDIEKILKHHMISDSQFGQFGEDLEGGKASVGAERFSRGYAWRKVIDGGGVVTGSSDSPLDSANPFEALYVGVTRCNLAGENCIEEDYKEKALTREEALRCYTTAGAFGMFQENFKGSLEAGKAADFAVISEDYFECPVEAIKGIEVLRTVVAGETVYEK